MFQNSALFWRGKAEPHRPKKKTNVIKDETQKINFRYMSCLISEFSKNKLIFV